MRICQTFFFFAFSVAAQAQTCTFTVVPGDLHFDASGGERGISVTASRSGCVWAASSDSSWARVGTPSIDNAAGTVQITAEPNLSGTRTATLYVAGKIIPVTQEAGQGGEGPPTITAEGIVNAGSYAAGPVAPGEIVTIYGTNLGPLTLATLQVGADGRLLTTIGETRVLFNGQPAPLVFSSRTQISAIVPYGVAGKAQAEVVTEHRGRMSNRVMVNVVEASPALFSISASNAGPGAFLNGDYSVNGTSNPAPPGGVLILYATGEGLSDPLPVDGRLTSAESPLPRPKLPVEVTVGGKPATVLYAGGSPGLTAGVLQVNVQLATDTPVGEAVPVVLKVGEFSSSSTVTAAVGGDR